MHHFYVFVSTNDPLSSSSPYFVQQRGLAHPPPPSLIRLHQIIQAQGKSMTDLVFVSVLLEGWNMRRSLRIEQDVDLTS